MNTNSSRAILELENNENFELLFAVYLMEREKRTLIEMFPLAQCGNYRIFLSHRFYVKSKLVNAEFQNLPFSQIKRL